MIIFINNCIIFVPTKTKNIMIHLDTLSIDEQFEILTTAQFHALENNDFDESEFIEEKIKLLFEKLP